MKKILDTYKKMFYLCSVKQLKSSYMETKSKKVTLTELGYNVSALRWLKPGMTFQTREDGAIYVFSHYVQSSKKFCYYRKDDINRYYYANGDKLVILV